MPCPHIEKSLVCSFGSYELINRHQNYTFFKFINISCKCHRVRIQFTKFSGVLLLELMYIYKIDAFAVNFMKIIEIVDKLVTVEQNN